MLKQEVLDIFAAVNVLLLPTPIKFLMGCLLHESRQGPTSSSLQRASRTRHFRLFKHLDGTGQLFCKLFVARNNEYTVTVWVSLRLGRIQVSYPRWIKIVVN